jgi:hypothetical protein
MVTKHKMPKPKPIEKLVKGGDKLHEYLLKQGIQNKIAEENDLHDMIVDKHLIKITTKRYSNLKYNPISGDEKLKFIEHATKLGYKAVEICYIFGKPNTYYAKFMDTSDDFSFGYILKNNKIDIMNIMFF